jgi:dihydroorotate dehydrogenase
MFNFEPEVAHSIAGVGIKTLPRLPVIYNEMINNYFVEESILKQKIFGVEFKNPVGLAAGFDKNGEYIRGTPALGFGYTEIGTVTPKSQQGNPKPRLFRLIDEESIQNAMGFNNRGSYYMLQKLKRLRFFDYPVGINIGKNKITPEIEAIKDYETLFKAFERFGTYIVINISSPNTPGLRDLQNEKFIKEVFKIGKATTKKPILLKIAPDMRTSQAIKISETAIKAGASGIIATNTTVDYSLSSNSRDFGGISGKLLKEKSFSLFKDLAKELYGEGILISVGGIDSADEAYRRVRAGANLIQIYSMLIYKGPKLIKDINNGLIKLLKADKFNHISEAVGVDLR